MYFIIVILFLFNYLKISILLILKTFLAEGKMDILKMSKNGSARLVLKVPKTENHVVM